MTTISSHLSGAVPKPRALRRLTLDSTETSDLTASGMARGLGETMELEVAGGVVSKSVQLAAGPAEAVGSGIAGGPAEVVGSEVAPTEAVGSGIAGGLAEAVGTATACGGLDTSEFHLQTMEPDDDRGPEKKCLGMYYDVAV